MSVANPNASPSASRNLTVLIDPRCRVGFGAVARRSALLAIVLGLLGVACAPPGEPAIPVSAGQHWLTQTVDFLSDAGRSPSLALDPVGLPHLAYLGLNQKLKPGEISPARPLTLPVIPAVLVSSLTKDGVWNHNAVIATQNVASPLPLKKGDLVAIAVDGQGNEHVAFTEKGALQYAAQSVGSYGTPAKIAAGKFVGLSIAVDPKGTPWVSWLANGHLMVATSSNGTKWSTDVVSPAATARRPPARSSIQMGPGGPVVAYTGTNGPMLAARTRGGWATAAFDPGGGGYGISLALDASGNPFVGYYAPSGLVRFVQPTSAGLKVLFRAAGGPRHPAGWSAGIGVDRTGAVYLAWYDGVGDLVRAASNVGGRFHLISGSGTENGELPQLAVTPDGSAVYVAWYDHVNLDLVLGTYDAHPVRNIAVAVPPGNATPSAAASGGPPAGACPSTDDVTITAPAGASVSGFKEKTVAAPASKPVAICFQNQEAGVGHNVAVFSADPLANPSAKNFFAGTVVTGVTTTSYDVGKLPPGSYFFHCDVHPTTMTGTLTVK